MFANPVLHWYLSYEPTQNCPHYYCSQVGSRPGRHVVSSTFLPSLLPCMVYGLVSLATDAIQSHSHLILVVVSTASQCLTALLPGLMSCWYMFRTFHLHAKFKSAAVNAAPTLVSCSHLSPINISSCRAEHGFSVAGLAGIEVLLPVIYNST